MVMSSVNCSWKMTLFLKLRCTVSLFLYRKQTTSTPEADDTVCWLLIRPGQTLQTVLIRPFRIQSVKWGVIKGAFTLATWVKFPASVKVHIQGHQCVSPIWIAMPSSSEMSSATPGSGKANCTMHTGSSSREGRHKRSLKDNVIILWRRLFFGETFVCPSMKLNN